MNMEWLNHRAGFSGLGMSSTGSSHWRQYIVSFWKEAEDVFCFRSMNEGSLIGSEWRWQQLFADVGVFLYPTELGWCRKMSKQPDVTIRSSLHRTVKRKVRRLIIWANISIWASSILKQAFGEWRDNLASYSQSLFILHFLLFSASW